MKRSLRLFLSIMLVLLALCSCTDQPAPLTNQLVMANLWLQSSAEYRALCLQAFQLARLRLDEALAEHDGERPLAVVADCDETVIATNRYGAWMITSGNDYSEGSWSQWMREDPAQEVAGAGAFLRYAASRGVEVFYITNRQAKNDNATLKNLTSLGFPNADADHLVARTDGKDKTARRDHVKKTHEVVLLLGDNLTDFDEAFRGDNPATRAAQVDSQVDQLGHRFIILPNPTYGEWEKVLYGNGSQLTEAERSARRRAALDPWQPK